jgi:hypothetical protein
VPLGYTANQANCIGVALNGSCTIINALIDPPSGPATSVPTMSQWMYVLLGIMLGAIALLRFRRL